MSQGTVSSMALHLDTFRSMSSTLAVQTNGLGCLL